jgi:hypothetical protein
MAEPYEHVNYDFGAADRLSWALKMAYDKAESFASYRARRREKLLGHPRSDNWQGARRDEFEREFSAHQRALGELTKELRHLLTAVEAATAQAHAVNARRH